MNDSSNRRSFAYSFNMRIKTFSPLLTIGVVIAIELLSQTGHKISQFAFPIYLTAVVHAAFWGGLRLGLISAAITLLDGVYFFSTPGQLFHYSDDNLSSLIVLAVTTPAIATMVGILERQVQETNEQLQQSCDFEASLKRLTDRVRDSFDEGQILQTALQELALGLKIDRCYTALYDLNKATSHIGYEYTDQPLSFEGRVEQMTDFREDYRQLLRGLYFQFCLITPDPVGGHSAILCCPIIDEQGVLGDIRLFKQRSKAFSQIEVKLVKQVANQCVFALRQARLYQAAQLQVKALEKLNQLKDDFLSTVSHELRTPITNIKLALQMLKNDLHAEKKHRYLDILQFECNREVELINNLLDLQRLEVSMNKDSLDETVVLQDWLLLILEPFQLRTAERQQSLQVSVPTDLPPLHLNIDIMSRILMELLNNACKYTPEEGRIDFSVRCQSQALSWASGITPEIVFTVSNQAEIPSHELPHIFKKFYRVPNADPWKQGGTGLGLALVQKLVEQLQGTIHVKSSEGWTTFTIQLSREALGCKFKPG